MPDVLVIGAGMAGVTAARSLAQQGCTVAVVEARDRTGGRVYSVRDFCEIAFSHAGLNWKDFVVQDPEFMRPAEVDQLIGNPAKAAAQLGWEPEVSFKELVQMMVDADIEELKRAGA